MPGAPLLPVLGPSVPGGAVLFNLTGALGGVQLGSVIPSFGAAPIADVPALGGPGGCFSFVTGEFCNTREPAGAAPSATGKSRLQMRPGRWWKPFARDSSRPA